MLPHLPAALHWRLPQLYNMSPRNRGGSSRITSRSRSKKKEPLTAAPNATDTSPAPQSASSPTRDPQLLLDNQNKRTASTVRNDSVSTISVASPEGASNSVIDNSLSSSTDFNNEGGSGCHSTGDNLRATAKVSDNRALSTETVSPACPSPSHVAMPFSPPRTAEDPFHSLPGDPWHHTFQELRAMQGRMLTLDKLESLPADTIS